jgi:hypothetical protein
MNLLIRAMNVKSHTVSLILCIAFVALASGCHTSRYSGMRYWMFIPEPVFEGAVSGYPAEVLLPPYGSTTNQITVTVGGEVVSPGKFIVPAGTTLLQGIGYAGGFKPSGWPNRVTVYRKTSGRSIRPKLRTFVSERHTKVWYETQMTEWDIPGPKKPPLRPSTDMVLESGDVVSIPRVVY